MSNQSESNAAGSLHPGTKVAFIVAAGFLATAAYFFMTPTHFLGKDGGIFGCGSPMSPNDSQLAKSQCSMLETVSRDRALLFLALCLLTALLGYLLFGTVGPRSARAPRTRLEDERDDDDDDDLEHPAPRAGAGRSRFGARSSGPSEARERGHDDEGGTSTRTATVGRPRLNDEHDDTVTRNVASDAEQPKVRTRLADTDERPVRRRLGDEDAPRERRRSGRYDDDAFDSVRD